jgi:hypothetical protein
MRSAVSSFSISICLVVVPPALASWYLSVQSPLSWAPGPGLIEARTGASAVLLDDGRVLLSGGAIESGVLASSELLDGNAFLPAASMQVARRDHGAVRLKDGRVLVLGGQGEGGTGLASAEIYAFETDTWTAAGELTRARVSPTALLLDDGRVLVAGGVDAGQPVTALELFDPATALFSSSAVQIVPPRVDVAAGTLPDGRVLFVGGDDGSCVSARSDLYDPKTDTLVPGPNLSAPRAGHSATTLLSGDVLVVGGRDETGDLATAERFHVASSQFLPETSGLSVARQGHRAVLLPFNGSVLIVGGTSGGEDLLSAERFLPWDAEFVPAGSLAVERVAPATTVSSLAGRFLVAGGSGFSSEVFAFPTIATEYDDYAPGETAVLFGAGFQPGAAVTLEIDHLTGGTCCGEGHDPWSVMADASGAFTTEWFVNPDDSTGALFELTADADDGEHAESRFTDSPKVGSVVVDPQSPSSVAPGSSATFLITVQRGAGPGSSGAFTANLALDPPVPAGTSVSFSPNPVSFTPSQNSRTSTLTLTTSGSTPLGLTGFTVRASTSASDFATNTGTLHVQANQTISFAPLADRNYGNPPFGLSATASSGLPVSFSVLAGPASVSGSTVTILGAGAVTIRASQAGNTQYSAAPNVDRSFTIHPALLSVTPADASRPYGQANPAFSGSIAGIQYGDPITASYASTATAASFVGTYPISATLIDPAGKLGNYTVTLTSGTLTIGPAALSVTPADASRLYGQDNPAFTGTLTGIQNGDNITATYSSAATAASFVGTYPITASLVDPDGKLGNYDVTLNEGTLTIDPAALTVTPADASRLYGQDNPAFTGTLAGIQNGDNITATYSSAATATSFVGTYPITALLVDPDGKLGNYDITLNEGTLTIDPAALTVTPADSSRLYGQDNPAFTGSLVGIQNGDNITASYSSAATAASFVGTYPITAALVDPDGKLGNYDITLNEGTLTIDPAALTVTPADASRLYGQGNPAFTGSLVGIQNGDNITASYSSAATAASFVGTYPILPTLNDPTSKLGNYVVTLNSGTLTIQQAALTVTPNDAARLYGQPNPTLSGVLAGIQNGDAITASYATSAVTASPIGSYPITATLSDPGGKLVNYQVTLNSGTLSVGQATLIVTADDKSKVLGAANPVLTGTIVGLQNSDPITATFTTVCVPASPVGSYPIVPSLSDPAGKLSNYVVTLIQGTLAVKYAPASTLSMGSASHTILQPINPNGSSIFKWKSSVPAKFRVCDAFGNSIGSPDVVTGFNLVQTVHGTVAQAVNETVDATNGSTAFHWDPTDKQWIFVINTKGLSANVTYFYNVQLNDGSSIQFSFGLK